MRHVASALVLVSLGLGCAAPQQEQAVSTEADVQAVLAVRAQEVANATSAEPDFSYLNDDCVIMSPGEPVVVGMEAALEWWTEFSSQVTINSIDYTDSDVVIAGDWAIERYAGSITGTPVAGGEPMTETVKGIHIYQRQADGTWKMAQDVWNSDAPPPAEG
jgi:ketosteroid isomerase-like protein